MSEYVEDIPEGYWAAFGYQNHLVPVHGERSTTGTELIGLCGVMTSPEAITAHDRRPTCSVCAEHIREGRYRSVAYPH